MWKGTIKKCLKMKLFNAKNRSLLLSGLILSIWMVQQMANETFFSEMKWWIPLNWNVAKKLYAKRNSNICDWLGFFSFHFSFFSSCFKLKIYIFSIENQFYIFFKLVVVVQFVYVLCIQFIRLLTTLCYLIKQKMN